METTKTPKSRGKASERTTSKPGLKDKRPKAQNKFSEDKIESAYQEFVLTEGKRPVSVYKFCADLGISEDEFYNHFGSLEGLEKNIWKGFIDKTVQRLHADKAYTEFSVREKVLGFYYTLFEELKANRSFVLFQLHNRNRFEIIPEYIKSFKASFENFISDLMQEGQQSGEIMKRPLLDNRYPQLFWLHMGFILFFWRDDDSTAFEKTDAAIEKSVNLAFDLIGKGIVDSAIDFGKFLYQNRN